MSTEAPTGHVTEPEKTVLAIEPAFFSAIEGHSISAPGKYECEDRYRVESGWAGVGDGMRGSGAGIASTMALRTAYETFREAIPGCESLEDVKRTAEKAHKSADARIRRDFPGCGTTLTTFSTWKNEEGTFGIVAWTGDSPAFLLRGESVTRLTALQDQSGDKSRSLWNRMLGRQPTKIAPKHLGSYFGGATVGTFDVESRTVDLQEGDTILLATDGLILSEPEIARGANATELVQTAVSKQDKYTVDDATAVRIVI